MFEAGEIITSDQILPDFFIPASLKQFMNFWEECCELSIETLVRFLLNIIDSNCHTKFIVSFCCCKATLFTKVC